MKKIVLVLGLALTLPLFLASCAGSSLYDKIYEEGWDVDAGLYSAAESPVGLVASTWADPHEKPVEDVTLVDLPEFAIGATDPYNLLPPPAGTFYVPWKLFVSVLRTFPFITIGTNDEGNTALVLAGGDNPGPLWFVFGPAFEELDSFFLPVKETVTPSFTPVPGNGDFAKYWNARLGAFKHNAEHIGNLMKYYWLNVNSDQPPYDRWFPDVFSREKTTIHMFVDTYIFRYDWDDPYIN